MQNNTILNSLTKKISLEKKTMKTKLYENNIERKKFLFKLKIFFSIQ